MKHVRSASFAIALTALLVLLSACTPPAQREASTSRVPAQPEKVKVLTFGVQREVPSFGVFVSGAGGVIAPDLAHNLLLVRNHLGVFVPQLAVEQISVERGTWILNPDGTMETVWHLHPNVRWHDGTPFTSEDLLFTFAVYKDAELPSTVAGQMRRMASAAAPDPRTFVVHWSTTDVKADQAPGLVPLPKHLLEDPYRTDKHSLPNNPYFNTGFVGLGPYRLTNWDSGVQLEFVRFDDYYRGRPPLDRVALRIIRDPNALIANILASSVDLVLPPGIDLEGALEVKGRWAGTNNRVVIGVGDSVNRLELQLRPDLAKPRHGLINRDVREALYRAMDRQAIADAIAGGLAPVADSWVSPSHPLRPEVESAIPQLPYDPARAQQLLEQAGWARSVDAGRPDGSGRGTDGVLVHSQNGERFEIELWGQARQPDMKEQPIVADYWKAVGVQTEIQVIPAATAGDREYEATRPGARVGNIGDYRFYFDDTLHSREIASAANRWGGRNKLGYSNPRVDVLLDQLNVTIDPRARTPLHREYLQVAMGDVAFMPIYWEVFPILALGSVKGTLHPGKGDVTWNIFEWDKE